MEITPSQMTLVECDTDRCGIFRATAAISITSDMPFAHRNLPLSDGDNGRDRWYLCDGIIKFELSRPI